MSRRSPAVFATLPLLAVGLTACSDVADRAVAPALVSDASTFASAAFVPLPGSAQCVAPPSNYADFGTYQPLDVSGQLSVRIVQDQITDFTPVAGSGGDLPDMLTQNETGPDAGRYLYRTHEVGSNGALTVTDLTTGITTVASQEPHYEALDGIVWTAWGTVLFAEERIIASIKDPRVPNAVGGLVYEYNPATGATRPLPALGARSHEGMRFDSKGALYGISESTPGSNGSGGIYKFVPDVPGDLSAGQLYALQVKDASRTGRARWVALDRNAVQIDSDVEAIAKGATGWGRPEDIEIIPNVSIKGRRHDVMYVSSTSEALVLRIVLDGAEATVDNFLKEGVNISGLNNPDNLELDEAGTLYVVEDNGPSDIWRVPTGRGLLTQATSAGRWVSLSDCSAELTGLYFDRTDSGRSWVNVQHAGGALSNDMTLEITRPRN
jgi:hypothetical protein